MTSKKDRGRVQRAVQRTGYGAAVRKLGKVAVSKYYREIYAKCRKS